MDGSVYTNEDYNFSVLRTLQYRQQKHQLTQLTTQPYDTPQCLATEQIPTTGRWKDFIRKELEDSLYTAYTEIWREGIRRQADGREHEVIPGD
eukprot:6157374-Amphidinium_carterae.1